MINKSLITVVILCMSLIACNIEEKQKIIDINENSTPLAFAYPVSDIKIDGEIDDWNSEMPYYTISALLESNIETPEDLNAIFKVGFSEKDKSVYVAIVVEDDKHIVDLDSGALSDGQDQCLIYLDRLHAPKGSGVNVYSFNELYKEIDDASTSWDPSVRNADWSNFEVKSKRSDNKTIYEAKITFDDIVEVNQMLGLDFMIYDVDKAEEDSDVTRISWRKSDGKTNVPFKLGHILLTDGNEKLGTLEGKLKWKNDSLGLPINKIRVSSDLNPSFWVREDVDTTGFYSIKLPAGKYTITPEWGIYNGDDRQYKINKKGISVNVEPNKMIQAPHLEIEVAKPIAMISDRGILLSNAENKYVKIDAFINAYIDYYEIPGVSLALIEDGKISYHNTYGVKNSFSQESVNAETIFEAASITKPVFAFAVARLAERGIIDLDKPLYQYLPFEEIAYDERYKLITARHVLSHKTGFPNWRSGKMTINFEPGTAFGYSGEGFEYLKRVVEKITSKDIVEVLEEEVIEPLNLKNLFFEKSDHLFRVVAHGHDDNYPHKVSLPNKAGMAWSMHTESKSFTDFAIALLDRKGIKKETYDDMFYTHTITDKYEDMNSDDWKSYFGLGIQLEKTPFGLTFGHGGNNGDFKCEFKVYQDLRKGFVVFTNGNTGGELAYRDLEQFLITGKVNF